MSNLSAYCIGHRVISYNVHVETHTHLTAIFLGLPRVSWYQKSKTNLDFTEARDSEWQ